jgi:hypothetical protein
MDETDLRILKILQDSPEISMAELGHLVGLSVSHGRDSLYAVDEFVRVVARIDLPRPGLVTPTDDAAVKDARPVRPVEEKGRETDFKIS